MLQLQTRIIATFLHSLPSSVPVKKCRVKTKTDEGGGACERIVYGGVSGVWLEVTLVS